jgi:isopropylmalate/homocitrate/citramalate synthase
MLENCGTYEPFAAGEVGHAPTEMVVGRHSGTRQLREQLKHLNLDFPPALLPALLAAVRRFAAVCKRNLTDQELQSLAENLKHNHGLPDL